MVAKVITVFNQKGGCGKTTVSMHVAGTLGLRGHRVLVVDMDEQGTATRWASQAPDESPFPATLSNLAAMGGKMHREIRSQIENYDYIVIDCPPAVHSPSPSSAMLVSDLALIPVVPAPADMWAVVAAKQLAFHAQATNEVLQVRLVPNMVQKKTTLARETLDVLSEDTEIPLAVARLGSRSAYRECQLLGATVHKISRARDAISEVESLVDEALALLSERRIHEH
jgi:chromosome partitioning protein